jgi:hypothetical protein
MTLKKDPSELKRRGRPRGSTNPPKLKLKLAPKDAKLAYYKRYGSLGLAAVYGVDKYTIELIDYLWKKPGVSIVATDPTPQVLANLNRKMSGLSMSMYRWEAVSHVGFVECGFYPVIVTTKEHYEDLMSKPNPHNVEIVKLEDL